MEQGMKLVWTMLKETFNDYIEDNALSRGAAIAYYTVLSIGPLLLICIAIAGLVFGHDAAQGAIVGQLRGMMGDQAAEIIQSAIKSAGDRKSGILATVLGFATLFLTATGVFGELQATLNYIWRAKAPTGVTGILKARAASLGLIATLGFLLLVSLVISAVLHAVGNYIGGILPDTALILQLISTLISFLIVSALFAAVYKILPDRRLAWKDVIVGAIATAFLFTIGKTLIGIYIGSSTMASSYGAASALVIVLVWIYYSSQIFLLGAEFTKVWASHHGSQEAFAARTADLAAIPEQTPQTAVQNIVAHNARQRTGLGFGLFEIAAVATLLLVMRQRR
jgi:membrane protein